MYNKSFLVDLDRQMFIKEDVLKTPSDKNKLRQLLICSCNHLHFFEGKVKRSMVIYNGETIEQVGGKDSLTCPKCDKTYTDSEKLTLLDQEKKQLIAVDYSIASIHKNEDSKILKRKRTYVFYSNSSMSINSDSLEDEIIFSVRSKKIELYIHSFDFRGTNSNLSAEVPFKINNIVTLKTINDINNFFQFEDNVNYSGLEEAFNYLQSIDFLIKDLDKIKEQSFIGDFYNSFQILFIDGEKYRLLDSGFGDDSKIKSKLNVGVYLKSLLEMAKVFFCISKFESLSTIFLTKGYNFFINYIQDNSLILNESILKKEKATFPAKILELSCNNIESKEQTLLTVNNKDKEIVSENESLKFSQNIYKNIKKPDEIIILNSIFKTGFINKSEIESLFLEYDRKDIFAAFDMLSQPFQKKINITLRHIKHLIKYKIFKDYANDNFLTEYVDTISIIEQIVSEKEKVSAKLERDLHKLSEAVIESYRKFLRIKESMFFDIRNKSDLKKMHNRLSSIHAIFQDEEKAEKYLDVVEKHKSYNDELDKVNFLVIPTSQDVYYEHFTMNHCIQTYINDIVKESYLAIRVKDTISNERATMGIRIVNGVFAFNQLKGFENSRATSFLIGIVKKYLKKHKINLEGQENNVDLQPDTRLIKTMDDYIEEDKVKEIRKKLEFENFIEQSTQ